MIPGGDWFALYKEDDKVVAYRVVCWIANEFKDEDGDSIIKIQGYTGPNIYPADEFGNFIEYRYQYKEDTKTIA